MTVQIFPTSQPNLSPCLYLQTLWHTRQGSVKSILRESNAIKIAETLLESGDGLMTQCQPALARHSPPFGSGLSFGPYLNTRGVYMYIYTDCYWKV